MPTSCLYRGFNMYAVCVFEFPVECCVVDARFAWAMVRVSTRR